MAVPERNDHVLEYEEYSDSLPAASILMWTDAVEAWEEDNSQVNPFVPTTKSKW
jgi:hypothetical protein